MKYLLLSLLLIMLTSVSLSAKDTDSNKTKVPKENNATSKVQEQIKKQQEREKKFAQEGKFYQGPEYDLSYAEVDPAAVDKVPLIEPDLEFDMDDVYD